MNDGVLAVPVHDFPLTLVDVEPSVLNMLQGIFPLFLDKALGMHGVPNVGKTPLGRIIAMAMSRYWVKKLGSENVPGYREASEFDFFRGEAGRQDRPDIFDDGSLPDQPMRKLKGFCDVGAEALTKERWGAAKFCQGQMRIYMSNDVDLTAEPVDRTISTSISHKDFMQMLEPAWMKGCSLSDIHAVLKRTCIVIITHNYLYCRPATEAERLSLSPGFSLLRKTGGEQYMAYRKGQRNLREQHELHLQWEQKWMTAVMDQKGQGMPPMPTETIHRSPFEPREVQNLLEVKVKSEKVVFKRALANVPHTIDIDPESCQEGCQEGDGGQR